MALQTLALTLTLLVAAHALSLPPAFQEAGAFGDLSRGACRRQPQLICNIQPTAGNVISGVVRFTPIVRRGRCRVRVTAEVRDLPGRRHGFHIHMYGDLSLPDGTSTGPHFANPSGTPTEHGFSASVVRHWGDLDNLIARRSGIARYSRVDNVIEIPGIVGRGITIHAGEDLGPEFQPTGNAGARIGVCTIGFANPMI